MSAKPPVVDARAKLRLRVSSTKVVLWRQSLEAIWKRGQVVLLAPKSFYFSANSLQRKLLKSDTSPSEPLQFWLETRYGELKWDHEFGEVFVPSEGDSVTLTLPMCLAKIT